MSERVGIETYPSQPLGGDPPPAPAGTTRAELRRVRAAWRSWGNFRPVYTREGDLIRAEINLKDHIWSGLGQEKSDAEAAWFALQDCITNWQRDIAVQVFPAAIRRWLRERRNR